MQLNYRFPYAQQMGGGLQGSQIPESQSSQIVGTPTPGPTPPPLPRPKISNWGGRGADLSPQTNPQNPAVKPVSPFMVSMYKSMQNITDPDEQAAYVQNLMTSLQERLQKYEFRLARGQSLSPEQQQQYLNFRGSFNDLQEYLNDPGAFAARFQGTDTRSMAMAGQLPGPIIPHTTPRPMNTQQRGF